MAGRALSINHRAVLADRRWPRLGGHLVTLRAKLGLGADQQTSLFRRMGQVAGAAFPRIHWFVPHRPGRIVHNTIMTTDAQQIRLVQKKHISLGEVRIVTGCASPGFDRNMGAGQQTPLLGLFMAVSA
jgi:hypothetical protein